MDSSQGEAVGGISHAGGVGSFIQEEGTGVSHGEGAGGLWHYVEVLSAYDASKGGARKWRCSFCKEVKTGGVNRVRAHLFGERNHGIAVCTSVPDDVKANLLLLLPQTSSKAPRLSRPISRTIKKREPCDSSALECSSTPVTFHGVTSPVLHASKPIQPSFSTHPILKQISLQTAWNPRKKLAVDSSIARFFNSCNIPFHVVRSPYFQDMIRETAAFGPSYTTPTCETLKSLFLEEEKSNIDNTLQIIRERWASYGCSIVCDDCSKSDNHPYQNILVCSRGNTFFVNSLDSSIYEMNACDVLGIWRDVIEYVGPHNVLQVIVDPAVMKNSVFQLLLDEFPRVSVSPCAAHCLNQLLEDISHLDWISAISQRGKDVVLFMTSLRSSRALFSVHSNTELLKPIDTRISNVFSMLERLAEVKVELRQTVVSNEWVSWKTPQSEVRKRIESTILCSQFWDELEELLLIVKPIMRILHLVDEDEPCIGKLYDNLDRIVRHIEQIPILASRAAVLKNICMERWDMLNVPLHAAAYVLDPEFQGNKQERDKNVLNGWEKVLDQLVSGGDEKRVIKNQLACYRQKEGFFGWSSAQTDRFKVSATTWWEDYGAEAKELQKLAIRILSQGCSSFSCRRLRSSFDFVGTRKRIQPGNRKTSDMVFVRANLRLLSKFRNDIRQEKFIGSNYQPIFQAHMLEDSVENIDDDCSQSSKS